MNKFYSLIASLFSAIVIASIYGIVHDQFTFTISPEYYTKFKFYQFGIATPGDEAIFPNARLYVALVGVMATWWMGLLIGMILGCVGLIHNNGLVMYRITLKAMLLVVLIAFVTGLIGLAYGKFYLAEAGVNWWLPSNLIDTKNFIAVGSMHNFSYLGGLLGLIVAIVYSIKQKKSGV
ncbi:hypothetical protein [Cytophaga aurantiaca]|uniref:hypothetical protein n=1 Tax=Cytophaga aurantiaca TaxID=29530 RepID=UPI00035F680B|nr:hypothetical protein [Cytophaga aurantiaca]